jgi:Leucine-rich repeat (LRR) protein
MEIDPLPAVETNRPTLRWLPWRPRSRFLLLFLAAAGMGYVAVTILGGRTLDLRYSVANDAQLAKRLEGRTQLQRLILSRTGITDAGLKHLEKLTQLKYLDLSETKITDAGLKHLRGLTP